MHSFSISFYLVRCPPLLINMLQAVGLKAADMLRKDKTKAGISWFLVITFLKSLETNTS